jgi:hypothetical protein
LANSERRRGERITFERGIAATMMAVDGSWRLGCTIEDMSESGARLTVRGKADGLNLKEFFLLLSTTGLAYRRCELSWANNDQIGVGFPVSPSKRKMARRDGHIAGA